MMHFHQKTNTKTKNYYIAYVLNARVKKTRHHQRERERDKIGIAARIRRKLCVEEGGCNTTWLPLYSTTRPPCYYPPFASRRACMCASSITPFHIRASSPSV